MKRFVASLIIIAILCFSQAAFAAPYSVDGGDSGNDSSVMALTNPAYSTVTVPSGECIVSGYSKSGAEISVYRLNAAGAYVLCDASSYVGASGIFFRTVALYPGRNSFVVRAQLGYRYKQVRFDAICFGFNNIY
ncbi:MAG: hypothetical protein SPL89_08465 [Clostridia bacterium]|nr:hypothetical protein [Clostridia bacterium]